MINSKSHLKGPFTRLKEAPAGTWIEIDPRFHVSHIGFIPEILRADDSRPVKDQLEDRYSHGGGWRPLAGFKRSPGEILRYPGDPPFYPAAVARYGDEYVIFYPQCSLLAVLHSTTGKHEVVRVD